VSDYLSHFMGKLDDLARDDYRLTDQDVVRLRKADKMDTVFQLHNTQYRVTNFGEMNKRTLELLYANSTAIIICASLTSYARVLSNARNAMHEAIKLFDDVQRKFPDAYIVLVFTNKKVFVDMLERGTVPLADCFSPDAHWHGEAWDPLDDQLSPGVQRDGDVSSADFGRAAQRSLLSFLSLSFEMKELSARAGEAIIKGEQPGCAQRASGRRRGRGRQGEGGDADRQRRRRRGRAGGRQPRGVQPLLARLPLHQTAVPAGAAARPPPQHSEGAPRRQAPPPQAAHLRCGPVFVSTAHLRGVHWAAQMIEQTNLVEVENLFWDIHNLVRRSDLGKARSLFL